MFQYDGKAEKKVVGGFRVLLAKTVGAGEKRQHGEPQCIMRRQQIAAEQEQGGYDDVVEIVDDAVQGVAVEPGDHFFHPGRARERAIRGIQCYGQGHQKGGTAKITLFDTKNGYEGDDNAERGVEVNKPGEDQTPGHPAELGRGGGITGPRFETSNPGGGILVLAGIDGDREPV